MKSILVTGGAGFIGSHFIKHLIGNSEPCNIINYDKLTYAGNLENLEDVDFGNHNYFFIQEDICDKKEVDKVMRLFGIDYLVNFAAESHVDRSITNSEDFVRTNVEGTRVLLDAAKKHNVGKFVQIGTDEVYGSLSDKSPSSKEGEILRPRSPYSASKAGADLFAISYFETHGLPVCVTRSSNNYGPNQYPEKVIPLFVTNILDGRKVPVYGEGKNTRDWLYVRDNCRAIRLVMENGKPGEIYNIAGRNEMRNMDLTKIILEKMGHEDDWKKQVEFVEDRKGHDWRYSVDSSKIERELGWKPEVSFEQGMDATINWYIQNEDWWKKLK
jgi:dTDP-glucose 4,6-dehydratase